MASKELFAAFVMHKTKRLLVGKSLTVFLEENTEKQENAHHYFSIGKHVDPYSPLQRGDILPRSLREHRRGSWGHKYEERNDPVLLLQR